MITFMRNKFFDWKILKEVEFDIPVITVGNIAVGGTGKTPHVEYIVGAFSKKKTIAVLSRGYRRQTKGFIIADRNSMPRDIGDESYQIYHKFKGEVTVAVCEDRVHGIRELQRLKPNLDLIILDDAFQHRYVKPTLSIVISEYARPIYRDKMLPYGRLREYASGIRRADILIVGKCPQGLRPLDYRTVSNEYALQPWQSLFFSSFEYQPLQPVFPDMATSVPYLDWLTSSDTILALAGIGNPRPFIQHLKSFDARVKVDIFPDHHHYAKKEIDYILSRFKQMKGVQKIIVTTEKDAVRLAANPYFPHELKPFTYYLPIAVEMRYPLGGDTLEDTLEKKLKEYMRKRELGYNY